MSQTFLYICAVVENPLVRMRVMRQGLTVWFDPEGGRKKTMGIRFPRTLPLASNELEILGPNREDVRRIKKNDIQGVDVATHVSSGLLVYELKVPLTNSPEHPFVIDVQPGSSLGIGIETNAQSRDMEEESRSRTTGGSSRPGGGGNPGMGRSGSIGGMPGAGRTMMPRKLRLWISVLLSQEKSRLKIL